MEAVTTRRGYGRKRAETVSSRARAPNRIRWFYAPCSQSIFGIQKRLPYPGSALNLRLFCMDPPACGGLIAVGGLWKRNSRSVPEGKSRPRGSEVPLVRAGRASLGGCDIAIAAAKGDSAPPVRSKTKNNLGDRRSCAWPWRSCRVPEAHAPTISRTAR